MIETRFYADLAVFPVPHLQFDSTRFPSIARERVGLLCPHRKIEQETSRNESEYVLDSEADKRSTTERSLRMAS